MTILTVRFIRSRKPQFGGFFCQSKCCFTVRIKYKVFGKLSKFVCEITSNTFDLIEPISYLCKKH